MDIAQTLKDFRAAHGLEQDQLAKLLETTQQTVSNWESGTMPRSGALKRINQLLTTYKQGQLPLPPVPRPVFDPAITEIHEVPVNEEGQFARYSKVKSESETRAEIADPRPIISNDDLISWARQCEERFFDALPDTLEYKRNAPVEYHGYRLRIDYMDSAACADFRAAPARQTAAPLHKYVEHSIHHLASVRRMLEINGTPRKLFIIVLCLPELPTVVSSFNRLIALASLHDVQMIVGGSPKDCADQMVSLLEEAKHPTAEDDFDDGLEGSW